MNSSQIQSLIRSAFKFLSGLLIAHGYVAAGNELTVFSASQDWGAVIGALGLIFSFVYHSGNPPASGSSTGLTSLLFALLLPAFLLIQGCAGKPVTVAYKAETATDATVSAAMTGWGSYVATYHPPVVQEQAVESAFEKVQASELLAIDTTAAFVTNGVTGSVESNALASASAAITDLVSLTAKFETATN